MSEGTCMECGGDYPVWSAPHHVWNRVVREEDGTDRWPFLCPTCFATKADEQGLAPLGWTLAPREST